MPTPAELGILVQRVAYAGLDAIRAAVPLDLVAYLHVTADAGPQLYLRTPDLTKMSSTDAFNLFSALRDTLDGQQTEEFTGVINGFESYAILTTGLQSRGLFVVGRREVPLDETEREMAAGVCKAVGTVAHALVDAGIADTDPTPVRVAVEIAEGTARADVLVSRAGEMRIGRGESPAPTEAVALATLDAVDSALKLVHCSEDDVGQERAVLVLVHDDNGRTALGSALCGSDHLQATAGAALQAAERLVAGRA